MKKLFSLILSLSLAFYVIPGFTEEKSDNESGSKFEQVLLKKGSLIVKEIIDFGYFKKDIYFDYASSEALFGFTDTLGFQIASILDVETGTKVYALRIRTGYYVSQYNHGEAVGIMDADEIDSAIQTLEYIKKTIGFLKDYSEVIYTSASGMQIGAYHSSDGNKLFVKVNSNVTKFYNVSDINSLISSFEQVKSKLGINSDSSAKDSAAPDNQYERTAAIQNESELGDNTGIPTDVSASWSIMTLGCYEQDGNTDNGQETIEWIVLDVQGDKALLLSKYGLDVKQYNTKWESITWEKSTLRSWLNQDFLNAAFSKEEQEAILTTNVDNSRSQGYGAWNTYGGKNTLDKLFLLSYAEANRYLGVKYLSSNMKSLVAPTPYAIAQGAYTSSDQRTADGSATGRWWLRSPGVSRFDAAYVTTDGSLNIDVVNGGLRVIRPALWVNLESGIF